MGKGGGRRVQERRKKAGGPVLWGADTKRSSEATKAGSLAHCQRGQSRCPRKGQSASLWL